MNALEKAGDKILGLFIFPEKCPVCDPNLFFYKKMVRSYGKEFSPMGIIIGDSQTLHHFETIRKCNFKVYRPADIKQFKNLFLTRLGVGQITLLRGDKMLYSISGNIGSKEYLSMKKLIKGEN